MFLFLIASCGKSENNSIPEVIVVSPHGSDIRREFEKGFSDWHQKKYGSPARIRWPDIGGGGTGNIIKQLSGDYRNGGVTSGYDIVFGGGSHTYEVFRDGGFIVKPPLDDAILNQVPKDIYGAKLRGEGDVWIAATMSNFGISYNKDRLRELNLPLPDAWEILASPQWFGHLSLADPSKSGSVRTSYDQIFVQHGWEKGWKIITHLFANTDQMREAGSAPSADVGSAQAVAGIVIDFYGRKEILRIGDKIVGFIIPPGGSVVDPDPIAMLKGAPNPEMAARFIEYVISPEGQKLWVFKAGTPGGPERYVLGRLSVHPELYKNFSQYMFDPRNPFESAKPLTASPESGYRTVFIGELMKATLIDNREDLVAARRAILAAGDPPDLLAKLEALPTFTPTKVNAGKLEPEAQRPITQNQQRILAEEYKPPTPNKDDPPAVAEAKKLKAAEATLLQTGLVNHWREEYETRLKSLIKEAKSRGK
jgi:ABC-type Fe3+ transport system substrate-binding protein